MKKTVLTIAIILGLGLTSFLFLRAYKISSFSVYIATFLLSLHLIIT